jgi:PKD repeat protein
MPSVLRHVFLTASLLAASTATAAPSARLSATPTTGTAPLVVGFDSARSMAGTIAEHFVLIGNGDAVSLATAEQTTNYNYTLPGFYLAQTWLRDETGVALSEPVPITVIRDSDGESPPAAKVVAAATTDPATFAFMATINAQHDDPITARRWDFGDGASDGSDAPFHTYAQPGVYQAGLFATSRAGMPLYGRVVVVVRDAGGVIGPSLFALASPEDASVLTPVTVTAIVEGVDPATKVLGAEVVWPDLADASPTVTPTASGITVTSSHALGDPGIYGIPVIVQLDGQAAPLQTIVQLTVGNIDDSPPSPVVLLPPSPDATAGVAYTPNPGATDGRALLVAGNGPFAFGAASPSPANFTVDGDGKISWTPTGAQRGPQRLAVRIVDANGISAVQTWVVDVTEKSSGCSLAAHAPSPAGVWPLALALALVIGRRYWAMARQAPKQGTNSSAPPASVRGLPTAPPT